VVATNDEAIAARIILHSGSYGHFAQSGAVTCEQPLPLEVLEGMYDRIPNFSLRITNLSAALLRPQLRTMESKIEAFNRHWEILESELRKHPAITLPLRHKLESKVGTSIQFRLSDFSVEQMQKFIDCCKQHAVPIAWFGQEQWVGFTSTIEHWKYIFDNAQDPAIADARRAGEQVREADSITTCDQDLPKTRTVLQRLCDVPLYHTATWDDADFVQIGDIIKHAVDTAVG